MREWDDVHGFRSREGGKPARNMHRRGKMRSEACSRQTMRDTGGHGRLILFPALARIKETWSKYSQLKPTCHVLSF